MSSSSERIIGSTGYADSQRHRPLHSVAVTRSIELRAHQSHSETTLMQSAGLAVARLALAVAPHARTFWIPCGPGNNGGDGMLAAAHLQRWGKEAVVSLLPDRVLHGEAEMARQTAHKSSVSFSSQCPPTFDVAIDAMFGIGAKRPIEGPYADWVAQLNANAMPVISVDVPSGLDADTGSVQGIFVRATHTLSLLTLKPGLFTAHGRDACGEIWFNDLGIQEPDSACALLNASPIKFARPHASHKGTYGDVCVAGGAKGMSGAAILAAVSALHGGAGRVYVSLLDNRQPQLHAPVPELMFRNSNALDLSRMVVVAGCGGGTEIAEVLQDLISKAGKLVLDADALNAIADSEELQAVVRQRAPLSTVITPHPLEAARLLNSQTDAIQLNRLSSALELSDKLQCITVLKGSGTIVAVPGRLPYINPTGNAKLATAGTGDVLAGLIGAGMAGDSDTVSAVCRGVFQHGLAANHLPGHSLTASAISSAIPLL